MRMDKLTSKFQSALADAQSLALGHDQAVIEPVHVFKAMLDQEGGSLRSILKRAGLNPSTLQTQLDAAIARLPQVEGTGGEIHISNELNRLLNQTDKLAQQRKDQFISSELLLLAACEDKGPTGELLRKAGITPDAITKAIEAERGG